MKKLTISVCLLITFNSCTTGSGSGTGSTSVTPTSTLSITFQGSTYTSSVVTATTSQWGTQGGTSMGWVSFVSGGSTQNVSIQFQDFVGFSISSGIGSYYANTHIPGITSMYTGGKCTLVDFNHGNAGYTTDDNDSASAVTITVANSTECKGTFTARLNNGTGTYSTATGSFDYRH
jgi:hypothetical protein